jgi:hypothetical protein
VALESLRAIAPHGLGLRRDVASPAEWHGRTLIAMYHPSRQSTLHRAQHLQEDDWRQLGALVRHRDWFECTPRHRTFASCRDWVPRVGS